MRIVLFSLLALAAASFIGCRDEVQVRVMTAGIAPEAVIVEVEELGRPTQQELDARLAIGDIDGRALLDDRACGGPCRALVVTLFVTNDDAERAAPPVVRLSSPPGRAVRPAFGFRAQEISVGRQGRIRFLVSLWPKEAVLDVNLSGSIFFEVKTTPPAPAAPSTPTPETTER